ncbi:MAG: hypothetical protein NTX16_11730, partial [Actinobacteria bacterium]|nr:hypothetical protein [Actinomycetota bacterium]
MQEVVKFFPPSAYYALSSMSEHALAYSQEPLSHRFLILYEAAGLESDFASYLLRSLLSEGHIRYETVDKKKGEGLVSRLIEREGPTGLIVTTTQVSLHPENETRLLSVPANDTPQQTAAIIRMLACEDGHAGDDDLEEWRTLQTWVAAQDNRVTVPFALRLADLVPPVAVRLRRDFATVLNLTKAHAILHQETRQRDASGRIVATVADYGIVRGLVADLVADEVGATVPATVVDTVAAVVALVEKNEAGVTYTQLGERLKLDKSSASRRAQVAVDRGYLHNLEDRKGRPARLVIGEPLPGEVTILPTVETLTGCMVARVSGGIGTRVAHSVSDDHVDDDPAIPVVAADLFGRAVAVVVSTGAASEHLIVTRCDCGQDEAVATLAELEKAGVVAPANGGKSRTVLIHEG